MRILIGFWDSLPPQFSGGRRNNTSLNREEWKNIAYLNGEMTRILMGFRDSSPPVVDRGGKTTRRMKIPLRRTLSPSSLSPNLWVANPMLFQKKIGDSPANLGGDTNEATQQGYWFYNPSVDPT